MWTKYYFYVAFIAYFAVYLVKSDNISEYEENLFETLVTKVSNKSTTGFSTNGENGISLVQNRQSREGSVGTGMFLFHYLLTFLLLYLQE